MPKYTKQSAERDFYIHAQMGRIVYHPMCHSCAHNCKQSYRVMLSCKKYLRRHNIAKTQERQNIEG